MRLADCTEPLESRRAPACCSLGQGDAGFSRDDSLGLMPSEREEMGQHVSWRHPPGARPSPCKVHSKFSAAQGLSIPQLE